MSSTNKEIPQEVEIPTEISDINLIDSRILSISDLQYDKSDNNIPFINVKVQVKEEENARQYFFKGVETIELLFGEPTKDNQLSHLTYNNNNIPIAMQVPDIPPDDPIFNEYFFNIAKPSPNNIDLEDDIDSFLLDLKKYGTISDDTFEEKLTKNLTYDKSSLKRKKITKKTQQKIDRLLYETYQLYHSKKYEEAREHLLKINKLDPINEKASALSLLIHFKTYINPEFNEYVNTVKQQLDKLLIKNSQIKKQKPQNPTPKSINNKKIHPITLKPDFSNIDTVLKQGELLYQQNQSLKAIETFLTIIKHDSRNINARNYLGYIFYSQKKYSKAITTFLQTLKYNPTNEYASTNLLNLIEMKKSTSEAATLYKTILKHNPTNINAIDCFFNLLIKQKDYDKAELLLKWGLKHNPTSPDLRNNLGFLYHQQKMFSQAEKAYQQIQSQNPTFPHTINNLANLYYEQQEYAKATQVYKTAVTHYPTDAYLWTKYGVLSTKTLDLTQAKHAFQQALKLAPQVLQNWTNLAQCLIDLEEIKEAEILLQIAIKYDQTNIVWLNQLAITQILQENFSEALQTYQIALKHDPYNHLTLYNFGSLLQLEEMGEDFEKSLKLLILLLQNTSLKTLKNRTNVSAKSLMQKIWKKLGIALQKLGKTTAANKAFRKSLTYIHNKSSYTFNIITIFHQIIDEINSSETKALLPSFKSKSRSLVPPDLITTANTDYT